MRLVICPEQQTNAQKSEHDRNVGQPGKHEGAPAAANIGRSQHSLHHVLVGAVCCHGDKCRSNQSGKNRVLDLKHPFPFFPSIFCRIEARGQEIGNAESAVARNDFVPAAGNRRVKQAERNQRAADHDRGLNEVRPDDGFDAAECRVDSGQNDDGNRRADINNERLGLSGAAARNHLVSESKRDRCDI